MLRLPGPLKILVCTHPVDLRCSFDGLANATRNHLARNPLSGELYVFFNRMGDQVRVLFWDGNGYVLLAKRLERGRFRRPWERGHAGQRAYELTREELAELVLGLDSRRAKRFEQRERKGAHDMTLTA